MNLLGRQNRLNRLGSFTKGQIISTSVNLIGLISYWSLENFNWLDAHSTNDLVEGGAGSPTTTIGKVGNAYLAVAADQDYIEHISNAALVTGDIDFTITLWVYLTTKPAGLTPILGKWDETVVTGIANSEWKLVYEGNDDDFEFIASNGVSAVGVEDQGSVSTATWYFIACGYDSINNVIRISRNASDYNLSPLASVNALGTANFRMGNVVANTHFHNGRIDEVGFWKRLLTVEELLVLYNNGSGLAYPLGN